MKLRSDKQSARERQLAQIKREKINAQLEENGFAHCECGASFTYEKASMYLDLHHIQQRSLGGQDTHENTMLLCRPCHSMRHEG